MPRASQSRFVLRTPNGEERLPKATDPEVALSATLSRVSRPEAATGVWEVIEYEDVIYRVHLFDNPDKKLDVRVEVVR